MRHFQTEGSGNAQVSRTDRRRCPSDQRRLADRREERVREAPPAAPATPPRRTRTGLQRQARQHQQQPVEPGRRHDVDHDHDHDHHHRSAWPDQARQGRLRPRPRPRARPPLRNRARACRKARHSRTKGRSDRTALFVASLRRPQVRVILAASRTVGKLPPGMRPAAFDSAHLVSACGRARQ